LTSRYNVAIKAGSIASLGQALALLMSLITAIILTQFLGPYDYAIYSICLSLAIAISPISQMGINAWLLSQENAPSDKEFNIALGGMLAISLVVVVLASFLLPLLEKFSNVRGIFLACLFTLALIPIEVLALPASTRLERKLNYKTITKISLMSQLLGQFLGVLLAYLNFGVWGPLIGWFVRSAYFCLACWIAVRRFPKLQWDLKVLNRMLGFGLGHTISSSINSGRTLIFLAFIGRWFGGDAVGIVGFTLKVSEFITPLRVVAGRLIIPLLATISERNNQLLNRVQQKTAELEILTTLPIVICGAALYIFVAIPNLDNSWRSSLEILPWVLISRILIVPHASAFSIINLKGYFGVTISITVFGIFLESAMLWILGNKYGFEGIGAATISFWIPFLIIHWIAIKRFSLSWNPYAQLWAWAGVFFLLSNYYGLILNIGFAIIILITWKKMRERISEVVQVFIK
jgi:teichuronic acid exporter